jgi:hypothetical protein
VAAVLRAWKAWKWTKVTNNILMLQMKMLWQWSYHPYSSIMQRQTLGIWIYHSHSWLLGKTMPREWIHHLDPWSPRDSGGNWESRNRRDSMNSQLKISVLVQSIYLWFPALVVSAWKRRTRVACLNSCHCGLGEINTVFGSGFLLQEGNATGALLLSLSLRTTISARVVPPLLSTLLPQQHPYYLYWTLATQHSTLKIRVIFGLPQSLTLRFGNTLPRSMAFREDGKT